MHFCIIFIAISHVNGVHGEVLSTGGNYEMGNNC
jgi:hypothetical protein